jgi:ABC-type antimicrobial peptide transport system permease subunit
VNIAESFKVAIEGIAANKVRAGLTMLGVVIGVGAVIAMLAIGQGARQQTMSAIQSMGTNVLAVMAGQMRRGPVMGGLGSTQNLKMGDVEAILKECPAVAKAAPEFRSGAQVKYGNKNTSTTIFGTSPDYPEIRNYRIARGKFFNDSDVRSMRRVAVIGPTVTYNLFGQSSPINKTIRIRGISFRVIGETVAKGVGGFQDPDDQIFIPITTAQTRVFGVDYLRSISVQVKSADRMNEAASQIETILRKRHRLGAASENDFMIFNQADLMETAEQASNTFTMLLAGIAAVSLIVGGIGIMNIMLVSVTERTREIGIRKAVGARGRDILLQFLIESVVLSLAGGIVGILLGVIGAYVIAHSAGWPVTVSVPSVILAFVFAAAVGIFFGIYPARRASFLNPIEALRYE